MEFFPTSPVIGFANPVAPPVVVEAVGGELRGTAFFDYQYEGPPTCVHGGVIAMVFDEMLGAANIMAGSPGMTGTLTIKYRKPTPLRAPLRLEARLMGREGRKITTYGAIFHGDVLTAEAEGLFIELVPQRFLAIVTEHSDSPEAAEQVRADARRPGVRRPLIRPRSRGLTAGEWAMSPGAVAVRGVWGVGAAMGSPAAYPADQDFSSPSPCAGYRSPLCVADASTHARLAPIPNLMAGERHRPLVRTGGVERTSTSGHRIALGLQRVACCRRGRRGRRD